MKTPKGLISRIERFSLHDGPGIRTLVVMKGCPLHCLWCSSPQTQRACPELLYIAGHCRGCGRCLPACPAQAVSVRQDDGQGVVTDRSLCQGCGACVAVCPERARQVAGCYYTVDELFREVEKDAVFYRRSGGGVTVGGGEATMQSDFVEPFLSLCQARHIHTVMETSAMAPWSILAPLISCLDLVYIDVKHMEARRHMELTGASNRLILENICRTANTCHLILRLPIVPGLNDTMENIMNTAAFAKTLGDNLLRLELLPYHKLGRHGYDELEREYAIDAIDPPADAHMEELKEMAQAAGIRVEIGG